jgi:hypothetical protein
MDYNRCNGMRSGDCDVHGNLRRIFRASPDIRAGFRVYRGHFKNAKNKELDDEGFARKWLEANPGDTVVMQDGSTRTRDDYGL